MTTLTLTAGNVAEVAEAASVIEIRSNGVRKTVAHEHGMTVVDALLNAGIRARTHSRFFVNDQAVDKSTRLNPDDTVVIAPRVRNG